jgi:hypothetical protein
MGNTLEEAEAGRERAKLIPKGLANERKRKIKSLRKVLVFSKAANSSRSRGEKGISI